MNSFIWSIDRIQTGPTTSGQSENNGNERTYRYVRSYRYVYMWFGLILWHIDQFQILSVNV